MKKINLFCLPFAGGTKQCYREYKIRFPSFVSCMVMEYAGRGSRIREALQTDMPTIVNDLYDQMAGNLEEEYALYGHSMGGLVAYLLARKIIESGFKPPLHLFITGTSGPAATEKRKEKLHLLDKAEFIEEVSKLRGLPEEILADREFMDFFEPVLRADFASSETYLHKETGPMDVPITVITGAEEDMKKADIYLWQRESNYKVDFRVMCGHHFFIYSHSVEIVNIIVRKLVASQKFFHYE